MNTIQTDSIPDIADVRESLIEKMERYRYAILGGLAVSVFGTLGVLAAVSLRQEKVDALRDQLNAIVAPAGQAKGLLLPDLRPDPEVVKEQISALDAMREAVKGSPVEPDVLFHLALREQYAGNDDRVLTLAADLKERFPEAPILRVRSFDSETTPLLSHIEAFSRARREFAAAHKVERPAPDASYVARIETSEGEMKVVFFREQAPAHFEAFLRHAKSGAFNGTRIYLVRPGEWIEGGGGDFTRNDDPKDDGEDDAARALPPADAARARVRHTRGTVTSVPLLSGDQSDRFAIVLQEERPEFDGVRSPIGELLDEPSRQVADRIASRLTYGRDPVWTGRRQASAHPNTPSTPITIWRTSIFREGVLDEGHQWDTGRVGSMEPEPSPDPAPPETPTPPEEPEGGK